MEPFLRQGPRKRLGAKITYTRSTLILTFLNGVVFLMVSAHDTRSAATSVVIQGSSVPPGVTAAAAAAPALPSKTSDASTGNRRETDNGSNSANTAALSTPESAQELLQLGLTVDIVAAEAAARPSEQLPSQYAVTGVIDPQSALFSEEPGVLVPFAQSKYPVGDWLAAVELAGPATALSDPMFVGTIFVPHNQAFEDFNPELRALKLQGASASAAISNTSSSTLALQLNCLTVPGQVLKLDELWPGRLLRTAGTGAIKVISNSGGDKLARLQHQPSGVYLSIMEPNLQAGRAVAHVVDTLPPATVLETAAVVRHRSRGRYRYRSVMSALADPDRQLGLFAGLVQRAGLTALLDSSSDAFTLFAPSEQALDALLASLSAVTRQKLLYNSSLADAFVSSHLVLGTALGSKALDALLPRGRLRTPQGHLTVTTEHPGSLHGAIGGAVVVEAGNGGLVNLLIAAASPPRTAEAHMGADPLAAAAPPDTTADQGEAAAAGAAPNSSTASAAGGAMRTGHSLVIADAAIVAADVLGGKAVLHEVDRVLISPALAHEIGLPSNPGYDVVDPPPPRDHRSGTPHRAHEVLTTCATLAAAIAALLLW